MSGGADQGIPLDRRPCDEQTVEGNFVVVGHGRQDGGVPGFDWEDFEPVALNALGDEPEKRDECRGGASRHVLLEILRVLLVFDEQSDRPLAPPWYPGLTLRSASPTSLATGR